MSLNREVVWILSIEVRKKNALRKTAMEFRGERYYLCNGPIHTSNVPTEQCW